EVERLADLLRALVGSASSEGEARPHEGLAQLLLESGRGRSVEVVDRQDLGRRLQTAPSGGLRVRDDQVPRRDDVPRGDRTGTDRRLPEGQRRRERQGRDEDVQDRKSVV